MRYPCIFLDELLQYYSHFNNHVTLNLPKLDIQYKDFAIWQRSYLTGKLLDKQVNYWKKLLDSYENINLSTDFNRSLKLDYIGNSIGFTLDKELSGNLRNTAKQLGVSLYTLLLASYYLMLRSYSNQDDIVIGTPTANRHYNQIENLIGFFVNSLPVRININNTHNITDFIKTLGKQIVDMQLHQDLPFEKLVNILNMEKDTSRHPIFQIMFGVQSFGSNSKQEYEENILLPYDKERVKYNIAKFDMETFIDDSEEILRGNINYRISLYKESTIKRLMNTYVHILQQVSQVSNNKELSLANISYLNKKEEALLREWNATDKPYPSDRTIHSLFEEQVIKSPNNVAVIYEDIRLTYKELNEKANRLANYIIKHYDIKPDSLIALLLDRSENMIISILGVLKAGAAYVPMDREHPDERIEYILDDTNTNLVISNKCYDRRIGKINKKVGILSIDDKFFIKGLDKYPKTNLKVNNLTSSNLAYVIYTSGTTGKPKGVLIEHRGVINRINWMQNHYPISDNDKILQKTPYPKIDIEKT